jgi:hypothetical protein
MRQLLVTALALLLAACGSSAGGKVTVVTATCGPDATGAIAASASVPSGTTYVDVALCGWHVAATPGHAANECTGVTPQPSWTPNEPNDCRSTSEARVANGSATANCGSSVGDTGVSDSKGGICLLVASQARFIFL